MLKKVRSQLSFANVLASLALFVALGGTSYAVATGSIDSREIKNSTIRSKDIRNGQVKSPDVENGGIESRDVDSEVALAKGFASIQAVNVNGPANVLNFGGQQTDSVAAQRVGTGVYDVTFTGDFTNVDSANDLTWQVTGRNGFSTGSVFTNASTASATQIKLRVFMRNPATGAGIDAAFSVQFYARTTT